MMRAGFALGGVGLVLMGLACGGGGDLLTVTETCPPQAVSAASWSGGTRVTLIALHPEDAYATGSLQGSNTLSGHVDEEMHLTDSCWMAGSFEADNGDSYYFYKGAFTQP